MAKNFANLLKEKKIQLRSWEQKQNKQGAERIQ